jgi:hypothetical protein
MGGARALSKVQYGKEAHGVRGTAVAATKIAAGAEIKAVPMDRKVAFIEDALGLKAKTARASLYELLVEDGISIPDAYFQILPMIFSCGLKGNITPSEVTSGQGDYLWSFTPSLTATNDQDSITLQLGDDQQAYRIEYTMFKSIKITGEIDQGGGDAKISIEVEYFGRQVAKNAFTSALSLPTMTTMNAKLARLYKDTAWSGKGVTELANGLRKFEFEIITGLHPKMMGSANKYFNVHGESYLEAMLTLTLEGNSDAVTLFDDAKTDPPTASCFGIKITGPAIGSGTNHELDLYIWGAPESVEALSSESNGNNLHQVLIHGMYDTTGAKLLDVAVTTNTSTI